MSGFVEVEVSLDSDEVRGWARQVAEDAERGFRTAMAHSGRMSPDQIENHAAVGRHWAELGAIRMVEVLVQISVQGTTVAAEKGGAPDQEVDA